MDEKDNNCHNFLDQLLVAKHMAMKRTNLGLGRHMDCKGVHGPGGGGGGLYTNTARRRCTLCDGNRQCTISEQCTDCQGAAWVSDDREFDVIWAWGTRDCFVCDGRGMRIQTCHRCSGRETGSEEFGLLSISQNSLLVVSDDETNILHLREDRISASRDMDLLLLSKGFAF